MIIRTLQAIVAVALFVAGLSACSKEETAKPQPKETHADQILGEKS